VDIERVFTPPRRRGLLLHAAIIIALGAVGGVCFWQALQGEAGLTFVLLLAASVAFLAPLPFILYRAYALSRASYQMDRDRLRLTWGLRVEEIPLPEVEWVRPAVELGFRLPLPLFSVPGAILGVRQVEGLGRVEFMASEVGSMLLVATGRSVYAISPAERKPFETAFYRIMELGSLTPAAPLSVQPVAFAQRIWSDRVARVLLMAGLSLAGALFLVSAYLITARDAISLGFDANLQPFNPGPPEHLLLLPVLGGLLYLIDLVVGVFFYRREAQRLTAYLVWAGCVLTPLLLLIALIFI
jgi:hypothetical protein